MAYSCQSRRSHASRLLRIAGHVFSACACFFITAPPWILRCGTFFCIHYRNLDSHFLCKLNAIVCKFYLSIRHIAHNNANSAQKYVNYVIISFLPPQAPSGIPASRLSPQANAQRQRRSAICRIPCKKCQIICKSCFLFRQIAWLYANCACNYVNFAI